MGRRHAPSRERAAALVAAMTLEEKFDLLHTCSLRA
jgi:purine nucleoside permease